MKLIDGIKLKGRPAEIPDCSRDNLPIFFKQMGYKIGAEIGVYKGMFSKKFCQAGLKLYAIDPYRIYPGYKDPRGQKKWDALYQRAKNTLSPYPNCTIIRKTSMEAVKDFADESLDFVYIDGNHNLKYVVEDICEWSKKVKNGGVICGHDYFFTDPKDPRKVSHIPHAVRAYVDSYNIKNWYVLGREKYTKGERRDRYRSWMWIKEPTEVFCIQTGFVEDQEPIS